MEYVNLTTLPVIVAAVVEVLKRTGVVPSNFVPLLSVAIGAIISYFVFGDVISGGVAGLTASGLYGVIAKSGGEVVKRVGGK